MLYIAIFLSYDKGVNLSSRRIHAAPGYTKGVWFSPLSNQVHTVLLIMDNEFHGQRYTYTSNYNWKALFFQSCE